MIQWALVGRAFDSSNIFRFSYLRHHCLSFFHSLPTSRCSSFSCIHFRHHDAYHSWAVHICNLCWLITNKMFVTLALSPVWMPNKSVVAMNGLEARFSIENVQHFDVLTIYTSFGCFHSIVLLLIWGSRMLLFMLPLFPPYLIALHFLRTLLHSEQFSLLLLHIHTHIRHVFSDIFDFLSCPDREREREGERERNTFSFQRKRNFNYSKS